MLENLTNQKLDQITDAGVFERLATSILRFADPKCAELAHPGVNAKGKTIKSPVDGFLISTSGLKPLLVAVHHTIAKPSDLEKKWLFDPKNADKKKLKGKNPTTPEGDLIKTAKVVEQEKSKFLGLEAALILTTNSEPSASLISKVKRVGLDLDINVEIWSRSRLADFLDVNPDGQWLRKEFLGINQNRLSRALLQEVGRMSLESFSPPAGPGSVISRSFDHHLEKLSGGLTIVVGKSGFGKSVACFNALNNNLDKGGFALVLPHEIVEQQPTLELAIRSAVRKLCPTLAEDTSPLSLLGSSECILIWIEDVNRSTKPYSLVEKLSGWFADKNRQEVVKSKTLCPIWPELLHGLRDEVQKEIGVNTIPVGPMTKAEGTAAVLQKPFSKGQKISPAEALQFAESLGFDPLLIALSQVDQTVLDASQVINTFVEKSLLRTQRKCQEPSYELKQSLIELGWAMLKNRTFDMSWADISDWHLSEKTLRCLKHLLAAGEIITLDDTEEQQIRFRHDRVRDSIVVAALSALDLTEAENEQLLFDPYLTRQAAEVLVRKNCPETLTQGFVANNAVALFYALRFAAQHDATRARVVSSLKAWLQQTGVKNEPTSMHWAAESALQDTSGREVLEVVRLLPMYDKYGSLAALRNGDVSGALPLMERLDYGVTASFRDRQIEHVKMHHLDVIVEQLDQLLRHSKTNERTLNAGLILAGFIGEARLANSITFAFQKYAASEINIRLLGSFLWSASMCCDDDNAQSLLEPICEQWERLPKSDRHQSNYNTRNHLAADGVRFGFSRNPPGPAIRYLVSVARSGRLKWQIAYMLHNCDQLDAIQFLVEVCTEYRRDDRWMATRALIDGWERRANPTRRMSTLCRNELQAIFEDQTQDNHRRTVSFDFWAGSEFHIDVCVLQNLVDDEVLSERSLRKRIIAEDTTAVPLLLKKLEDGFNHWSFYLRYQIHDSLTTVVTSRIEERAKILNGKINGKSDIDYHCTNYLTRLPQEVAEEILAKNWDGLKASALYIHAALYCSTPKLEQLVQQAVSEQDDPSYLFEMVSSFYGIKETGHPGVRRIEQITVLKPYLDFIPKHCLSSFSEECNAQGWYDLRREMFDGREGCERTAWSEEYLVSELDRLHGGRHHCIDYLVDREIEKGVTWSWCRDVLLQWYAQHKTLHALEIIGSAVKHMGSRTDLPLLKTFPEQDQNVASAIISDITYAVRFRSFR